jgi:hypothetical protein
VWNAILGESFEAQFLVCCCMLKSCWNFCFRLNSVVEASSVFGSNVAKIEGFAHSLNFRWSSSSILGLIMMMATFLRVHWPDGLSMCPKTARVV